MTTRTRPIRADALYLVEWRRYTVGRPERATKVFRSRVAAQRWATHQADTGRGPVRVWTAPPPTWTEVRS